jgi:acid phosphatase (class A)
MPNYAICGIILIMACLAIITGCANIETQGKPAAIPEVRPGILAGYLTIKELPDSSFLLPTTPAPG